MESLEQSKIKLKAALGLLEAKIHEQIKSIQILKQENKRVTAKNMELEAQLLSLKQPAAKMEPSGKDMVHTPVNKGLDLDIQTINSVEMSINELKNMVSKK